MSDTGTDPTIALVGEGPAIQSVDAAISDLDATSHHTDIDSISTATFAVVVGDSETDRFTNANHRAIDGDTPWIAVELGGIGGHPTDSVTVTAFAATGPCYACLRTRIAANAPTLSTEASVQPSDTRLAGALAGHLLATHGLDEPPTGTLVEIPATYRTVLPVPTCPACATDPPSRCIDFEADSVSLETTAEYADRTVDDNVGIVSRVGERDSFPAPYYLAELADTTGFSDATVMTHAAGVDADWDAAYVKAIGEALERYAAGVYRSEWFHSAPAAALERSVEPSAYVRPDSRPTVSSTEVIDWLPATHLPSETQAFVPAELTVFPPPTESLAPAITTGLGLGTSQVQAILSGLYETIERDATMLSWYSTYDPISIDVDNDVLDGLHRRAAAEDLTVHTVLLTQDIDIPVVGACVTRETWPRFAAGSAANLDAEQATYAAVAEALQNWMELRALGREQAHEAGAGVARYADQPDPVTPFFTPEHTVASDSIGPTNPTTGRAELANVTDCVAAVGGDVYTTRLTTRDLEAVGFEVVRVQIPSAQPLFMDDPYFGERARTVPPELGYEPSLDRIFHPYP